MGIFQPIACPELSGKQSYYYGLSVIDTAVTPSFLLLTISVILRHEGSFTERFFTTFRMTIAGFAPGLGLPRLATEGLLLFP